MHLIKMTTRSCLANRSPRAVFFVVFVTFVIMFLFLFSTNSFNEEGTEKLKRYLSVEDAQYNLIGYESFKNLPVEKYHCDPQDDLMIMNSKNRLQQDHPCVIDVIRRHYLKNPPPFNVPLHLDDPQAVNQLPVQTKIILPLLKNKTNGFYIECGAADGEYVSNTLYMEQYLHWDGILIEADKEYYDKLLTRKRKAYALHTCLSLEPYPTTVYFHEDGVGGKVDEELDSSLDLTKIAKPHFGNFVRLQCFPLYSILLAVGRTEVDYFSVDVEGSETKILKTVPWHRVDIKTLTVEVTSRNISVVEDLVHYMETQRYKKVDLLDGPGYYDLVFLKE